MKLLKPRESLNELASSMVKNLYPELRRLERSFFLTPAEKRKKNYLRTVKTILQNSKR